MSGRTVHAIRINLHTVRDRSVIVWPDDVSAKLYVQLMNPRRTWLTVQCGDSVMLTHNGEQTRQAVESIELHRVFPASGTGCASDPHGTG